LADKFKTNFSTSIFGPNFKFNVNYLKFITTHYNLITAHLSIPAPILGYQSNTLHFLLSLFNNSMTPFAAGIGILKMSNKISSGSHQLFPAPSNPRTSPTP